MPDVTPPEEQAAGVWVFGYGSLLWNPGFAWSERRPALLQGYHRAFCRYSFRHRGTPEAPGLVIGLQEGGSCLGLAYRIAAGATAAALAYLDGREGAGYHRLAQPIQLQGSAPDPVSAGTVTAWVYVPNTDHPSYFGQQDPARIAGLVATGKGESGTALDYLRALIAQLKRLGVAEPELTEVLRRAEALRARIGAQPAAVDTPSRVG
jgi:cation transport protein ChaC